MKLDELKARFPNAAKSFYRLNAKDGADCDPDNGTGTDTEFQESEANLCLDRQGEPDNGVLPGFLVDPKGLDQNYGAANNRGARKRMDGVGHPQYRITITLRFSDYRRHDPDGCCSTLLDCFTRAIRRLLDLVPGSHNKKPVVRSRPRGRDDRDSATGLGRVPF